MPATIHYTNCPVCGASAFRDCFDVKDYTVSGKSFLLTECTVCTLRLTQDVPDANSIAPYYQSEDYISHSNTKKGLINRLYLFARTSTMRRKRRLVKSVTGVKSGTLLDLGSGTGTFVHTMHQAGWEVTGLEPDGKARQVARDLYGLELSGMEQLNALPPGHFDAITLWHVLEHVHELNDLLFRLQKLLKPRGRLLIAVPNYTSLDAAIYGPYWAAYDVPRHLYHFSPEAMEQLMQKAGLQVERRQPMWFDSFYISMLSSKYKHGKTHFIPAAWNGFRSNLRAWANTRKCSSVIYVIGDGKPA